MAQAIWTAAAKNNNGETIGAFKGTTCRTLVAGSMAYNLPIIGKAATIEITSPKGLRADVTLDWTNCTAKVASVAGEQKLVVFTYIHEALGWISEIMMNAVQKRHARIPCSQASSARCVAVKDQLVQIFGTFTQTADGQGHRNFARHCMDNASESFEKEMVRDFRFQLDLVEAARDRSKLGREAAQEKWPKFLI